ncbi:pyridoxal phosphate-dependent transferase, partial [Pelagophyceae sp. CCMP2097]
LSGNSLGLQPAGVRAAVLEDLDRWAAHGVEGHFVSEGPGVPWVDIEERSRDAAARIVGADDAALEVALMNSTTVNLHVLLSAFYQPTAQRNKILIEAGAFPSDDYAVQSTLQRHGYGAAEIVRVDVLGGVAGIRDGDVGTDAVVAAIERAGSSLAVVLVGALQYYSGALFDVKRIADAAHAVGAIAGFDVAHAAGNIDLRLHDDGADFACWCSYKYLNAGPGAIAGAFVHARHADAEMPGAMRGWWGNKLATRFEMRPEFDGQRGVAGLQLANPPTLPMVQLGVAYAVTDRATMTQLRVKSIKLTAYLELCLERFGVTRHCRILTPRDSARRGCQLSLKFEDGTASAVCDLLRARDVFVDLRRPDVIRVAPAPLYNTFSDARRGALYLAEAIEEMRRT